MTHLAGQRRLPLKQKSCFNTSGKANYHGMNPFLMTLVKDGQALADLIELPKLTVPRPYFRQRHDACNMFVVSDASMKAYGAVVYICHQDQISLVMSKNRVAPTKPITLPKLELMAAVMATRLANFVKSSLHNYDLSTNTHLWTDSQIVLYWIYKQTSIKTFIHQRVTEIVESFPPILSGHLLQHQIILLTSLLEAYPLSNYSLHNSGLKDLAGYSQNPNGRSGYLQASYTSTLLKQRRE